MNGYDIQLWTFVLKKMEKMNMHHEIHGEKIELLTESLIPQKESYPSLGFFDDIKSLYDYLCGYETGFSRGKFEKKGK